MIKEKTEKSVEVLIIGIFVEILLKLNDLYLQLFQKVHIDVFERKNFLVKKGSTIGK